MWLGRVYGIKTIINDKQNYPRSLAPFTQKKSTPKLIKLAKSLI